MSEGRQVGKELALANYMGPSVSPIVVWSTNTHCPGDVTGQKKTNCPGDITGPKTGVTQGHHASHPQSDLHAEMNRTLQEFNFYAIICVLF